MFLYNTNVTSGEHFKYHKQVGQKSLQKCYVNVKMNLILAYYGGRESKISEMVPES